MRTEWIQRERFRRLTSGRAAYVRMLEFGGPDALPSVQLDSRRSSYWTPQVLRDTSVKVASELALNDDLSV
jgi:hypothetical protein